MSNRKYFGTDGIRGRVGDAPITGTLIGTLSAFPFFMALVAQSIFWIVFFSIMLANIAHDMVVCVQQPSSGACHTRKTASAGAI